jgi:hypothetical protein
MEQKQTKGTKMRYEGEWCEICRHRQAEVFIVVRQGVGGREHVVKAHVCLVCFEGLGEMSDVRAETVSLGDYMDVKET